jgi:hypothetical protein
MKETINGIYPTRRAFGLLLATALAFTAGADIFPVGTYVVTGALKDYKNMLCTADDGLTVQAVAADGVLLAETTVVTSPSGGEGVNFALQIPLSSSATEKTAAVGDVLNLVVVAQGATNCAPAAIVVYEANASTNLVTQLLAFESFPSASPYAVDGQVQVAKMYLDQIAPWLQYKKISAYDPDGDWDGDGQTNYAEYIAGTSPFDATDCLRVTDYHSLGDSLLALSFEYVGGHVYGLRSTESLVNPEWAARGFKATYDASAEQTTVTFDGTDEDADIATIYLAPVSGRSSEFFRIEAK